MQVRPKRFPRHTREMPWQTSERVMKIRSEYHVVDVIVETLDGWRRHISGRNASVLAFFTFLSIFPLMLAATTILGFVLKDNVDLQQKLIDGAADHIPVIGQTLKDDPRSLDGSSWSLVIGLLGALWSSTKAFVGLQGALDDTWEVPVDDRASMPIQRGRALVGLLIMGGSQVGSVVLNEVADAARLPGISVLLIFFGTIVLNILVIASMYRFLTSANPTWRDVWPGAIIAGVAISVLLRLGPVIVERITDGVEVAYQSFYVVIGLVTWLGFISIALLMSAELNAAIVRLRSRESTPKSLGDEFDLTVR